MWWVDKPERLVYGDIDLSQLNIDQAFLNITSDQPVSLYSLSDDCNRCPFYFEGVINDRRVDKVSTKDGLTWRLYTGRTTPTIPYQDENSLLCQLRAKRFGQFGVYSININKSKCQLDNTVPPVNIYFPLLWVALGLVILALLLTTISSIWDKFFNKDKDNVYVNKKKRILSIDTFRGITVVLMIFVNYGAGGYSIFEHAVWNGLHLADVIFPWFMWIMGVCIPFSIGSQLKKNISRLTIFTPIIKRSVLLFLLGLALNTMNRGPELSTIRIMGVLQRFAICYFVVATLVTFLSFRSTFRESKPTSGAIWNSWRDISMLLPQWTVIMAIFAAHCYLTFFFPVPGCEKGYLGPGGIQYDLKFSNCTGGVSGYIDKLVLGVSHLYQSPTSMIVYKTGAFDPEGLLGCLTSIVQVFLGVQAGVTLLSHQDEPMGVVKRWVGWGIVTSVAGTILCQARQDAGWVPINKNLWSFSFVCLTSGLGFLILALLYFIIDTKIYWKGAPFSYVGMNPTIMYVGHQLTHKMFPWHWRFGLMNSHMILLVETIWATSLWVVIAYWLYLHKFFLSL